MTVSLARMRPAHTAQVAALELLLFADDPWSKRLLDEELSLPGRHYVVALDDAEPPGCEVVGYAGLADFGHEAHVMTIGVRSDRQRHGLGEQMLADLVGIAEREKVRLLLLEVAVDNEPAKRLYDRNGFTAVGVRRNYYEKTGTDAVVMTRELT